MLHDDTQTEVSNEVAGSDVAQAGAICYRRDRKGRIEVLLVGSRRDGRWGVPKGHIEIREASSVAASREAFEEAGIVGVIDATVFGRFSYQKDISTSRYCVAVHLLKVSKVVSKFPEKGLRRTAWFSLKDAVHFVAQPGLRLLLSRFEAEKL